MSWPEKQYDDILRWQAANPNAPKLSNKEQKDLRLWDSIRHYEKIGKLINELKSLIKK